MTAERSNTIKWLITLTVMLVAVMEVLDITIVNVALREMMGTFGATISQITWVITAYVVASAIVMPLTGFLVDNFGRRRILLINISGFLITSLLCGISSSLLEIIVFRALQGVFGASLIPLSQFILRDTFPPQELGKAMAVWAMGIMVGPILGPTLGGYITEHLSWHWVFFINVPVCVIAFVMTLSMISESKLDKKPIDWWGIFFLALGVGCFQTFIEEGYRYNWFASHEILALFVVSIFSIAAFIIRSINNPNSVIKMSIFRSRQFVICTLLLSCFCMALFGALVMQPLMAEVLMGYPPSQTGLMMAPRGLASLLAMPLIPILMKRLNGKWLLSFGLLLTAYGTFLMAGWNLQTSMGIMAWDTAIQGLGMSFIFAPLSILVFEGLSPSDVASASGMFSFGRSMGLSIGVAALSTVLTNETQINWNRLGAHISEFNSNLIHWINIQHLSLHSPIAISKLSSVLYQQASMVAYLDVYWLAAIAFLAMIPLVWFIKIGHTSGNMIGGH
jgi:DHA2 family multidrug resistance protein